MAARTRPSIEWLGTPAHVWATLSCDQRTEVIAALARLAVQWLSVQPAPQRIPYWKEVHDDPHFDPSQNPSHAS
jgi:hypothetical protein